jgi:hypothetical protein
MLEKINCVLNAPHQKTKKSPRPTTGDDACHCQLKDVGENEYSTGKIDGFGSGRIIARHFTASPENG